MNNDSVEKDKILALRNRVPPTGNAEILAKHHNGYLRDISILPYGLPLDSAAVDRGLIRFEPIAAGDGGADAMLTTSPPGGPLTRRGREPKRWHRNDDGNATSPQVGPDRT